MLHVLRLVTGLIRHGVTRLPGAFFRLHRAGRWASLAGVVDADGGDALERSVGAESLWRRILRLLRNIPFPEFRSVSRFSSEVPGGSAVFLGFEGFDRRQAFAGII